MKIFPYNQSFLVKGVWLATPCLMVRVLLASRGVIAQILADTYLHSFFFVSYVLLFLALFLFRDIPVNSPKVYRMMVI